MTRVAMLHALLEATEKTPLDLTAPPHSATL